MTNLQDKLEKFKQLGMYQVSLTYGEDMGCDDSKVPIEQRRVILIGSPVGCLGEVRMMFYGTLLPFLDFNLKSKPTVLTNPPKGEDYEKGGYFIWGTKESVDRILSKPFHGKWI